MNNASRPIVVGRFARADLCPCSRSIVLSLGGLSLRLECVVAEDVALTLMQALAHLGGLQPPAESALPNRDRDAPEESN